MHFWDSVRAVAKSPVCFASMAFLYGAKAESLKVTVVRVKTLRPTSLTAGTEGNKRLGCDT
jgi:hypothetical protein